MNPDSYQSYSREASGWLHSGRKQLIKQALTWYLNDAPERPVEILEVGAGVGQNIEVLRCFGQIDAMEIDPLGLEHLRLVEGVRHIFDVGIPSQQPGYYDVILACDVIEHIQDDVAAMQWIFDHLRPGGLFFATVPAFQRLFSDHDRALGHCRRYQQHSFDRLLPSNAIRLAGTYFNTYLMPLAVVSRILYQLGNRIRGSSALEKQRVPARGFAEPVLKWIFTRDVAALHPSSRRLAGLSYFVCARKQE